MKKKELFKRIVYICKNKCNDKKAMNKNQIAIEIFGKCFYELNKSQQEIVWDEVERRQKIEKN